MAQHKMEKEFGKKLNQREIIPSPNAWDRLDAMLTVAGQPKPKRDFGWLYIAATILGFLFLGILYFKNIPEVKDVPRNNIVIENQSQKPLQQKAGIIPATPDSAIAITPIIKSKSAIKTRGSNSIQINETPKSRAVIAQNPAPNQESRISQKTVQPLDIKPNEPLANAAVGQKSIGIKTSIKVDPKSLLSQVDGEINLPFREKMLRKINKNYKEVAEAVSNRNIEQ